MLDTQKIAAFLASKRKSLGLTQSEMAQKLNVSYQAISKWENGTLPNVEMLVSIAELLHVTTDEILAGQENNEHFSYSRAGVDISYTDAIKKEMASYLCPADPRVLNGLGPFASLYDIRFPEISDPVLVLKSEEPGSKQKLAMEYGYSESVCHDMINHLVNDIIVMGAKPLAVLDTIVCGSAEKDTIRSIVKGISDACRENECSLVGGETSIQPQVIDKGVYILTSSIAGIVSRSKVLDGSAVCEDDAILAVASNGLHTNGYSLVRMLMDVFPHMKLDKVDGETFIEQIMKPHTPYYRAVKPILGSRAVHAMAHITGGGIEGNLCRVIPDGLCAEIDLSQIETLPIFRYIRKYGSIPDSEMLSTFNCGVGLIVVVSQDEKVHIRQTISQYYDCYEIGTVRTGESKIVFRKNLRW